MEIEAFKGSIYDVIWETSFNQNTRAQPDDHQACHLRCSTEQNGVKHMRVTKQQYDAVLFDLDGVLTATAKLHCAAWKSLFDAYLRLRAERSGTPFVAFDAKTDYLHHVDGKPRLDGVRDFLHSREIELPEGKRDDPAGTETVWGFGNHKDGLVNEIMARDGVEAYEGSVAWVNQLRAAGFKTGVVSSSYNCETVLRAAGIVDLFEHWVDGRTAERLSLAGKPAPDAFLAAAEHFGVPPARAVVVEDAIAGVQAARAGGFGLIVGVSRHGDAEVLRANGADIVVDDLAEMIS
jgi:beta-phosphoglucomutase family hydrolase